MIYVILLFVWALGLTFVVALSPTLRTRAVSSTPRRALYAGVRYLPVAGALVHWTLPFMSVASVLGILAALITMRFVVQAIERGVEERMKEQPTVDA